MQRADLGKRDIDIQREDAAKPLGGHRSVAPKNQRTAVIRLVIFTTTTASLFSSQPNHEGDFH